MVRSLIAGGALAAARHDGRLGVAVDVVAAFEGAPGGVLSPGPPLTAEDVARDAPFRPGTIKAHARQGLIPSCRIGGQRRFHRAAFDTWLAGAFEPRAFEPRVEKTRRGRSGLRLQRRMRWTTKYMAHNSAVVPLI